MNNEEKAAQPEVAGEAETGQAEIAIAAREYIAYERDFLRAQNTPVSDHMLRAADANMNAAFDRLCAAVDAAQPATAPNAEAMDDAELFEDYDSAMSQYERSSGAVARTETWARVKKARKAIISRLTRPQGDTPTAPGAT